MRRLSHCKQPSAGLVIHIASTLGLVYAVLLGLLTVALEQTHREVPQIEALLTRPSFHAGLDLSAPYMSPIYATAAGIVTYAGYRSGYGRVVEIDHGNAISTVYGHSTGCCRDLCWNLMAWSPVG
jgi:hypothetical protein